MANPVHLAILRQGVDVWNQWRQENPDITPDLSWINTNNIDLSGAYLFQVDLSGASFKNQIFNNVSFSKSNLYRADFSNSRSFHVCFSETNLIKTNFASANLVNVNFLDANLSHANFYDTRLSRIVFDSTILENTKFTESKLNNIYIANIDLSQVINLETIISDLDASSRIDFQSIFLSKGKIPKVFLEACGITDELLQALPTLLGIPQEVQYVEVPKTVEVINYIEPPKPSLNPKEIQRQLNLLEGERERLHIQLQRLARIGKAHATPELINDIKDARTEILKRKVYLRKNDVTVDDFLDDEEYE